MVLGFAVVPIVSAFARKPDRAAVDDMFSCYERTYRVRATEALGDEVAEN